MTEYKPSIPQREFHDMGYEKIHRLLTHGQQTGGTYACAMETAMHLTGEYPDWWDGARVQLGRPKVLICGREPTLMDDLMVRPLRQFTGWRDVGNICAASFDSDMGAFEDERFDVVWFDGEPTVEFFDQATNLLSSRGISMMNFVPLNGMSGVAELFIGKNAGSAYGHIVLSWLAAAHLPPEWDTVTSRFPRSEQRARLSGVVPGDEE